MRRPRCASAPASALALAAAFACARAEGGHTCHHDVTAPEFILGAIPPNCPPRLVASHPTKCPCLLSTELSGTGKVDFLVVSRKTWLEAKGMVANGESEERIDKVLDAAADERFSRLGGKENVVKVFNSGNDPAGNPRGDIVVVARRHDYEKCASKASVFLISAVPPMGVQPRDVEAKAGSRFGVFHVSFDPHEGSCRLSSGPGTGPHKAAIKMSAGFEVKTGKDVEKEKETVEDKREMEKVIVGKDVENTIDKNVEVEGDGGRVEVKEGAAPEKKNAFNTPLIAGVGVGLAVVIAGVTGAVAYGRHGKCASGDEESVGGSIGEGVAETFGTGGGGRKKGRKPRFWEQKPTHGEKGTDRLAGSGPDVGPAAGEDGLRETGRSEDSLALSVGSSEGNGTVALPRQTEPLYRPRSVEVTMEAVGQPWWRSIGHWTFGGRQGSNRTPSQQSQLSIGPLSGVSDFTPASFNSFDPSEGAVSESSAATASVSSEGSRSATSSIFTFSGAGWLLPRISSAWNGS